MVKSPLKIHTSGSIYGSVPKFHVDFLIPTYISGKFPQISTSSFYVKWFTNKQRDKCRVKYTILGAGNNGIKNMLKSNLG